MINPFIYFLLFLKASLFSTGGFSNLPSLHQDLISNGWAVEADFGQSIAIGQISPGPNGLWVISMGCLTYGFLGALLALIAITHPGAAGTRRLRRLHTHRTPSIGAGRNARRLARRCRPPAYRRCNDLRQPGVDWKGLLIAAAAFGLAFSRKVNILIILSLAGLAGYLLYR